MEKTQYGFILKFWVNISSAYSLIFEDLDTKVMFFLKINGKTKYIFQKNPVGLCCQREKFSVVLHI